MLEEDKKVPVDSTGAYISLQNINKVYDNKVQAVFDFNLNIQQHELIVFVGPSGCGKSTTLRMIAGLEEITSGNLFIDGVYCNEKTAKERDVSMVFQNYALYPHMTVYENMAFGLKVRKFDKEDIDARVRRSAEILQITEYLNRRPKELSGGQRQRVALGRAIVRDAKVFLMDEPLSNLDAKLRVSMRSEIIKLHKKINATTIYVTHDQTEAMTMASRIVVMKDGYIQQIGEPKVIYNHPANTFVATFIGTPAMNLLECTYRNGVIELLNGFEIPLTKEQIQLHDNYYQNRIVFLTKQLEEKSYENVSFIESKEPKRLFKKHQDNLSSKQKLILKKKEEIEQELEFCKNALQEPHKMIFGIRPEDIYENEELPSKVKASNELALPIQVSELLGSEYYIHMNYGEKDLIVKCTVNSQIEERNLFHFVFDLKKMHLFDKHSTLSIF